MNVIFLNINYINTLLVANYYCIQFVHVASAECTAYYYFSEHNTQNNST